jgi:hypothetical protein
LQKTARAKAGNVLSVLLDPYLCLGMTALMPLLDCINTLVKFAQARNVFICDFVAALVLCRGQIFEMYRNDSTSFTSHHFLDFKQLVGWRHEQIHLKWDLDMNDCQEVLAFTVGDKIIPAKHDGKPVTKGTWASLISEVKSESTGLPLDPMDLQVLNLVWTIMTASNSELLVGLALMDFCFSCF